jgi:hypothetical protein
VIFRINFANARPFQAKAFCFYFRIIPNIQKPCQDKKGNIQESCQLLTREKKLFAKLDDSFFNGSSCGAILKAHSKNRQILFFT